MSRGLLYDADRVPLEIIAHLLRVPALVRRAHAPLHLQLQRVKAHQTDRQPRRQRRAQNADRRPEHLLPTFGVPEIRIVGVLERLHGPHARPPVPDESAIIVCDGGGRGVITHNSHRTRTASGRAEVDRITCDGGTRGHHSTNSHRTRTATGGAEVDRPHRTNWAHLGKMSLVACAFALLLPRRRLWLVGMVGIVNQSAYWEWRSASCWMCLSPCILSVRAGDRRLRRHHPRSIDCDGGQASRRAA